MKQDQFINQVLKQFGLTKNEILVYLEAIKHEEISPYQLSRNTHIPRTTVYDIMMSLSLKKLITIKTSQGLEKQQSWIVPQNPSILREIVRQRKQELNKLEVHIVDILSDLKKGFLANQNTSFVRYYPGIDGVKQVLEKLNNVPTKSDVMVFDHLMPMDTLGKVYTNADVQKGLTVGIKKNIRRKTIIPWNRWTQHVLSYQYGRNPDYITHNNFRYVDIESFQLHQDIYIIADIVYIITAKGDEAWGAAITSRLLFLTFSSLFSVIWQLGTPIHEKTMQLLGKSEFIDTNK